MNTNHRLRIATISVICFLLVVPATVPADGIEIGQQNAAVPAAPAPVASEKKSHKRPDNKRPDNKKPDNKKPDDKKPVEQPDPIPNDPQPEEDQNGPPAGGGSTEPTGSTDPTGPEPGEVGEEPNPGTDPANPTPAPDSGAPAPPAAPPAPASPESPAAPADEGTATDEETRAEERTRSDGAQLVAPGEGTVAAQVANTLAAITVPEETVRQRAAEVAESTRVGAETIVLTRIVENVPDWVGFAMVGLSLLALLSLGVFWRERRRRHSAEVDAMVDSLTGIPNRKAFDRRLDLEWRRAARYGRSLGLMVMDLDGFKAINDLKGHAAGDQVLREVAQKLDGRMRDTDLVARIGGDEFAVICPETGINELMTIRGQLAEQATRGLNEPVGLSIGVAEYVPGDHDSASILARADESMYRVKRGERSESVAQAAHA